MKHFVHYLIPGSLFSEEGTKEIPAHDVKSARDVVPNYAFAFTLYDTDVPPGVMDETHDTYDVKIVPKRLNVSGKHYIGGQVYCLEEIEAMGDKHDTLASNMRSNKWDRVIKCKTGNWQPFEDGDVVI